MRSSIALAALVATTIGFGAVLPVAADDIAVTPPAPPAAAADPGMADARFMPNGGMRRGMAPGAGMLGLACSPKGAETLEVALVHMSYRLQLTADQQKLFDTFREKALTTETNFADTCKTDMPARTADAKPDLLARLKAGLALDSARLTALNDVLPDFEALYNSLTDTQKQALFPHRGGGHGGMQHGMGRPQMPSNS